MLSTEKVSYKKFRKTITEIIAKYPDEARAWLDEVYKLDVD